MARRLSGTLAPTDVYASLGSGGPGMGRLSLPDPDSTSLGGGVASAASKGGRPEGPPDVGSPKGGTSRPVASQMVGPQRTEPQHMPKGPSSRLAKAQLQGGASPGAGREAGVDGVA